MVVTGLPAVRGFDVRHTAGSDGEGVLFWCHGKWMLIESCVEGAVGG